MWECEWLVAFAVRFKLVGLSLERLETEALAPKW